MFVQPINQVVCALAVSQIDIDNGDDVGSALGNKTLGSAAVGAGLQCQDGHCVAPFGIRYGGCRAGYIGSQCAQQTLDGIAYMPGIFNQEDTAAF